MKKIALMTWHHVENYGTAFQAYALKSAIEMHGCDVEIINYERNEGAIAKQRYFSEYIMDIMKSLLSGAGRRRVYNFKGDEFKDFYAKNFKYTASCVSRQDLEELNEQYDGFVCGSDQIWSPRWFDSHFYLDFVSNNNKLISYAPSFGLHGLARYSTCDEILMLTNRFKYISIREKSGRDELNRLSRRTDIRQVIDPVLLFDADYWSKLIFKREKKNNKPYIFVFFLKNNEKHFQAAMEYAKTHKLDPVVMHCTQSIDNKYANIDFPSPNVLLDYIENASCVCTDSFHIMVFSIIFCVQFVVFNKYMNGDLVDQNDRLIELMDDLGIDGRIYDGRFPEVNIDYEYVADRLSRLREQSIDYLSKAVSSLSEGVANAKTIISNNCEKCDHCNGEYTQEFKDFIDKHKNKYRFIEKHLLPWNFSLSQKCYGCEKLHFENRKWNLRCPSFYSELITDMKNQKSLSYIYNKYYLSYDFVYLIKKLTKGL